MTRVKRRSILCDCATCNHTVAGHILYQTYQNIINRLRYSDVHICIQPDMQCMVICHRLQQCHDLTKRYPILPARIRTTAVVRKIQDVVYPHYHHKIGVPSMHKSVIHDQEDMTPYLSHSASGCACHSSSM